MNKFSNFDENAIREAAYYIWKNNGCQSNSSLSDWNLAIQQLSNSYNNINTKGSLKSSSCSSTSLKKCSKSTTTSKKTSSKKSK